MLRLFASKHTLHPILVQIDHLLASNVLLNLLCSRVRPAKGAGLGIKPQGNASRQDLPLLDEAQGCPPASADASCQDTEDTGVKELS